jgi:hypothetical protein
LVSNCVFYERFQRAGPKGFGFCRVQKTTVVNERSVIYSFALEPAEAADLIVEKLQEKFII